MHVRHEDDDGHGVGSPTPFEDAHRLLTALLSHWPYAPHEECPSILLVGQTGNGKSCVVDRVVQELRTCTPCSTLRPGNTKATPQPSIHDLAADVEAHRRVHLRTVTPDLAPLMTMRERDGGTALRRHLRRAIRQVCAAPLRENIATERAFLPERTTAVPPQSESTKHTSSPSTDATRCCDTPSRASASDSRTEEMCHSVLVILDHMEFFIHAEADESDVQQDALPTTSTSASTRTSAGGGGGLVSYSGMERMSLTHVDFVIDLYTVLRSSPPLFSAAESASLRLRRIVYVALFTVDAGSGGRAATPLFFPDQVHRFVRDHCFDHLLLLPTPSEAERRRYFHQALSHWPCEDGSDKVSWGTCEEEVSASQHNDCCTPHPASTDAPAPLQQPLRVRVHMCSALANALAVRSGGITYAGLTEMAEALVPALHDRLASVARVGALSCATGSEDTAAMIRAMAAADAHRIVKSFRTSGTVAAQEYRCSVGYVDVQQTRWRDIAGMDDVKQRLQHLVTAPLKKRALYRHCGVRPSTGVLLHGPPGTGKTMLAKAMATELNASFVYLNLPELLQAEVGESERVLEQFFATARERSPTVMFIDELQAAFGVRYDDGAHGVGGTAAKPHDPSPRSSSAHDTRLVSNLLYHLDTAQEDEEHGVLFVGATNVVHLLDPQILRAGRLDTRIEIPLPDQAARTRLMQNIVYGEWACWFTDTTVVGTKRNSSLADRDSSGNDAAGLLCTRGGAHDDAASVPPCHGSESNSSRATPAVRDVQDWLIDHFVRQTEGMSGATVRNMATLFALHLIREITTEIGGGSRGLSGETATVTVTDVRAMLFDTLASEMMRAQEDTSARPVSSSVQRASIHELLKKTLRSYGMVSM